MTLMERMQALETRLGALDKEPALKSLWRALVTERNEDLDKIEAHLKRIGDANAKAHDANNCNAHRIRLDIGALELRQGRLESALTQTNQNAEDRAASEDRCDLAIVGRIEKLEQRATMAEKHGAALSDVRRLRAELVKRIDALEARLPAPIPIVEPLARNAWRDLGNLSVEPTRATKLRCDDCRVTWTGCAAISDCPECGRSVDWTAPGYSEGPEPCGREESEELRAELGAARVELLAMQERAEAAERMAESRRASEHAMQRRCGAAESECAALRADRDHVLRERDDARAQLAELRRAHDTDAATCEEALDSVDRLTAEVERLRAEHLDSQRRGAGVAIKLAAANALLSQIGVWADTYGCALVPHGGAADTFGDGVRACKRQVKTILAGQPAAQSEHIAGCRYEREFPVIDPEDCPRCACEHPEEPGTHGETMCEIDDDQPAARSETDTKAGQDGSKD